MPNKTAWVVGRGLAEVEPSMVNLSGPPANFSKCYENSVPNPGVLELSLQQSDQSRECSMKIGDPEMLHADRDPRTAMHPKMQTTFPARITLNTLAVTLFRPYPPMTLF